jgi:hypothetical protein
MGNRSSSLLVAQRRLERRSDDESRATLLYEVKPLDPVTFIAVTVLLIITAAIAVAAPAWRAARVDPVVAFRSE